MSESRLFPEGTVPECATPDWYQTRDRAPHLEQGGHHARLIVTAGMVGTAREMGGQVVVDLGAGDGGLLSLLSGKAWGYDLQPSNIEGAKERGVRVDLADVLADPIEWADIAVCTEMLEHLIDPHGFVRTISGHARFLVASSPAFETAESHYAFHLWCWDLDGYRALAKQAGFSVVRHEIVDQFQVLLARVP